MCICVVILTLRTAKLQMLGEEDRTGTQLLIVKERNAEH